jgi:hypothetical protein
MCKPTTKSFTGPKNRSSLDKDAAGLHFMKETHAEGIPVTWQPVQVKTTEIIRSLGITNVNTV